MPQLILASQSPRRQQLLGSLGVAFTSQPADVDETPLKNETPLAYVKRIAVSKAQKVAAANPGAVVIAADTPVIVGRQILQSAHTEEEARRQLKLQSGRRVRIPTMLVCIDAQGKVRQKLSDNWVKFKRLSEEDLQNYIDTGLWQGVSGAFRIQNDATQTIITTMHGSISGIIGLPLYETSLLLRAAGIKVKPTAG